MDLNLEGKVALVVASSQGLGKAIAERFVKENVNVMITSRNEEKLKDVCEELNSLQGGKAHYFTSDITNDKDIKELVKETKETFGQIDILVNNSGGPPSSTFLETTDEMVVNAFELNLLSYIRITREAIPELKKTKGKIINIASSSIKEPIPGLFLSNIFRQGVVGLTKTLAEELASDGILVNTVAPGRIATERIEYLDEARAKRLNISKEEIDKNSKRKIPLGRYGQPEEFAKVVCFIASGANGYITGSSILVDGGMVKSI